MKKKFQVGGNYSFGPLLSFLKAEGDLEASIPNTLDLTSTPMIQAPTNINNTAPNILRPQYTPQNGRDVFGGIDPQALVGFGAANALLSFLGQRKSDREQQTYVQQNLNNPYLGILPSANGQSENVNYGYKTYQMGGGVDEFEQLYDDLEKEVEKENPSEEDLEKVKPPTDEELQGIFLKQQAERLKKLQGQQIVNDFGTQFANYEQETNGNFYSYSPSLNSATNLSTPDLAKQAHEYYLSKGIPEHVSAGILGNLIQESGLNPNAVGDGGKAKGIAQWHPDRYKGLVNFSRQQGRNPNSLETQLDYVLQEPGESERVLKRMFNTNSASEAAHIFSNIYERPNKKFAMNDRRAGYANSVLSGFRRGGTYYVSEDQLADLEANGYKYKIID